MEIGIIIKLLIKEKGLTQVEVADKIGKSLTALNQIVNGSYYPTTKTLDKICEALEIPKPILYFLTISEDDIPADKLEVYRMLVPSIRHFLITIFGKNYNHIVNANKMV